MVIVAELVVLVLAVALGVRWLLHTKLYRSKHRSPVERMQDAVHTDRSAGEVGGLYDGGSGSY